MGVCGNTSIWAILSFIVIILALILQIIAIATVSWMIYQITTTSIHVGLWKMKTCTSVACTEGTIPANLKDVNFNATQGMEIVVVILLVLCTLIIGLYCFLPSAKQNWFATTAIVLCFITALFGFIGMITWVSYVPEPYIVSYALGLAVIAAFFAWIAGLLLLPDVLRKSQPNRRVSPRKGGF